MRWSVHVLCVMVVALAWSSQLPAGDDVQERAEARRQFDLGKKAFAAKRFRDAALAFEAACEYRASGTALYTAGLAWAEAGAPDRAADAFSRALTTPGLSDDESPEAQTRLSALEKTVGVVVVTGPSGTTVAIDDHTPAPTPARLHGTPGKHFVVARLDDRVDHHSVLLRVGDPSTLDVTPAKPVSSAPLPCVSSSPPAPPPAPVPVRKFIGIGVLGAGVAAAGAAAFLGAEALGSRDAYNAHPTLQGYEHASSMQTATNVAWVAAGILGAAGITLIFWPSGKAKSDASVSVSLMPAPHGLGMGGAW
jgi:hypothetical protein